jgi:hypothetical protein
MTPTQPAPWNQAADLELAPIKGVCLDIDETLSTQGKLTEEAFAGLWTLKRAGFFVVPVTGRPAGWCDHIARFWPVDAVVGENGAFTFFMQNGIRSRLNTPGVEAKAKLRLQDLAQKILTCFPHAQWASDQAYREYDLAIDICEDVPRWPEADVEELLRLCESEGAHAKLSSVHVNAWFGDYDKRRGMEFWLGSGAPGLAPPAVAPAWDEWLFIGDSPNDEPMFASFRFSVGVANLSRYLNRLRHPPTWLTSRESGGGFAEMANRLVQSKK